MEWETEGPDPYGEDYVDLGDYGKIKCRRHGYREGSVLGLNIGSFNSGEIEGEDTRFETRADGGGIEMLTGVGRRQVMAELIPGPKLRPEHKVNVTVDHSFIGAVRSTVIGDVELSSVQVAADSELTISPLSGGKIKLAAKVHVVGQRVNVERTLESTSTVRGEVNVTSDDGSPSVSVEGEASANQRDRQTSNTVRQGPDPSTLGSDISVASSATEVLTTTHRLSRNYVVTVAGSSSSSCGTDDAEARSELITSGQWTITATVFDAAGNQLAVRQAGLRGEEYALAQMGVDTLALSRRGIPLTVAATAAGLRSSDDMGRALLLAKTAGTSIPPRPLREVLPVMIGAQLQTKAAGKARPQPATIEDFDELVEEPAFTR
jgi:hypothetical protein